MHIPHVCCGRLKQTEDINPCLLSWILSHICMFPLISSPVLLSPSPFFFFLSQIPDSRHIPYCHHWRQPCHSPVHSFVQHTSVTIESSLNMLLCLSLLINHRMSRAKSAWSSSDSCLNLSWLCPLFGTHRGLNGIWQSGKAGGFTCCERLKTEREKETEASGESASKERKERERMRKI